MKALFIRCYGKLTADMMIGGLIDMGVPPVYLKSKLKDAGLPDNFIEKPNPKAQISAHYFHIPPYGDKPLLLKQADLFRIWKDICSKGAPEWEETGWKVFSALTAGVSHAEDVDPFAAAMLEGLSAAFMPMDGRFLTDRTAYGSSSAEKPTGDNTLAEYLGYFTDRGESVFSRHMKVFGMSAGLDL